MIRKFQNYLHCLRESYLSSGQISKIIVRNSTLFLGCLMVLSLMLIVPASHVKIDTSGVSFTITDSEDYRDYLTFVESFGTDDYILLAVKNSLKISNPKLKKRVKTVHEELVAIDSILEVIDLGSIESSEFLKLAGISNLWDEKHLARLRQFIPGFDRLISDDMKTLAFIVKINNDRLNGFRLEKQLKRMKQIIVEIFPEHPHCYAAGIPVLRAAFERYNLKNALVFGSLGLLFGTLIAVYIFRTLWAAVLVILISLATMLWTLGIMGLVSIDLNLATGLSFGFILVVSTTTVFHIVTTYLQLMKIEPNDMVLTKTLQTVMRPCFMCALTTATGFLSLTMSPVPMIRQAGIIISIGVLLSFFLTLVISSFFLPKFLIFNGSRCFQKKSDLLDRFIKTYLIAGFNKPTLSLLVGIVFILVMSLGIPKIQTIKHLTNPFIKNTQEAKDLEYIKHHISTGTSFSIILQSLNNNFNTREFWYDLIQFEEKIKSIPGIEGIESLTQLVFRMALKFSPAGIKPEKVFYQIQSRDNDMIRTYFDPVAKRLRIIVHIQSQTSDQVEAILKQVKDEAEQSFSKEIVTALSGQLILLRSQTLNLVSSQMKTLFLALFVITILMIIQLKSVVLGMLSLIPNLFPLITIFGIMGWFHIPLDPLTIFAAVISFGLSVDDSIHYLTQLKREMSVSNTICNIQDCLKTAYHKTSRALVSTTAVLFLSALGLLFSSFSHVFSLGVLISSACVISLFGDLVFMPAAVLTFRPFRYLLSHKTYKKVS